ncbi:MULTISPECIES: ParM/StbA family protein [Thiorhodovibrio]|uniref:ParM/StbA family protein n=1 Tax=Thiorhodovibrio TaxID=61593 RepID=UPI001911AC0B|nr:MULTISPECIES: ParM/StbA family protein [Thiorhodovibrio]MBK5969505.1 hypothetical protein [Thiorhodovibrio winogradskyi]WPL15051.1 plasmid segregation protein ParM [Thiorhodovibrio litoralis]
MYQSVIGLDIGHSAVKLSFDTPEGVRRAQFSALACTALPLRDPGEAALAARETVTIKGRDYFVGETAAVQGKAVLANGLTGEWIASDAHAALMAQARRLVEAAAGVGPHVWVLGLPVAQYQSAQPALRQVAGEQLGAAADLFILPQPLGGYYAHLLDRHGLPQPGRAMTQESWAVIDVGYYSTDIVLLHKGRWVEAASGGCAGVRLAVEYLQRQLDGQGINLDLIDAETALRTARLRHFGQSIDLHAHIATASAVVAEKVIDLAGQLLASYVQGLDGVLVIGGGADLVLPALKAQWPHARGVEDAHHEPAFSGPRYSVSEGYYRHGRNRLLLAQAA